MNKKKKKHILNGNSQVWKNPEIRGLVTRILQVCYSSPWQASFEYLCFSGLNIP